MGETEDERTSQAGQLFENFVQASTCKGTLQAFGILCRQLELDPLDYSNFYRTLKVAVSSWKVKALWTKLDKRAQHKVYNQSQACQGTRCLIIGGGPCGLRTAIELALLGCKVVVIEKRDTFSRHNVLHLWPFTIHDLRGLGAKKFYGKFCAGSIDHISIRQLQLMLLKVCLILGVEIHVNVEFVQLVEPPEEQTDDSPGWRAEVQPSDHPVSEFDFEVVIGADGRKSTLKGFSRKEFRGKLAIAITANFVNRNTTAEVKVEEISGVAFIFNQKFFLELKEETGIDLENIVYYKDHTHYFVMTAKKQSLLDKGVIINDCIETEHLLSNDNVSQEALLSYAREAADFGTNYQLPSLDYAINHYGQPDVAMFDFTSMYASENAALIREKHGHQLLVALVGDSLLEPFWPMGTGCARGFLAAFDTAWMIRGWVQSRSPLEILAERESIYRLLHQTTPENISKNFDQYTIDPGTRYPNLNSSCVRPHQVRHLLIDGQEDLYHLEKGGPTRRSVNLSRKESEVRPGRLLTWCQKQTQGYRGVDVTNLTSSWKNGLALCALIHRQRPELIDFDSFNEEDVSRNNQLAFDIAEREFGIQPVTTGKEMAAEVEPDKLLMVLYLSKFYEAFRNSPGNNHGTRDLDENGDEHLTKNNHSVLNLLQPRKRIPRDDKKLEDDSANKRRRKGNHYLTEISCHSAPPAGEDGELRENKVRSMASQLQAKFEENSSTTKLRNKCSVRKDFPPGLGGSDICHFCSKRVYVMERLSAGGYFFHRECFRCNVCNCTLRLGGHAFDSQEGKFYCKMHYAQWQSSAHLSRVRRRTNNQTGVTPSLRQSGKYLTAGGVQIQPAAGTSSLLSEKVVRGMKGDRDDTEMAVEALETSCVENPSVKGNMEEENQSQDGAKEHLKSRQNNRWKRKLQATFPLVFVKRFQKSWTLDREEPETVPEADCDVEIASANKQSKLGDGSKTSADNPSPPESSDRTEEPSVCSSISQKKRLTIKLSDKEKLLNWDVQETFDAKTAQQPKNQVAPAETEADKPQLHSGQEEEVAQIQTSASPLSAFQLIANAFRRTFSVTNPSSGASATASMRTKGVGPHKPRPMSEGTFKLGPLFSTLPPDPFKEEKKSAKRDSNPWCASLGTDPWGSGHDLPSLLQQVSLQTRKSSGGVFVDDMASLPRRRLDLFSSLRLRKREGSESKGKEQKVQKEIRTILTNLRKKAASQQNLEELSSTDDENENPPSSQKVCTERQRRKQEKTAAQQAKREQLKRLHRAQVIQRQLEEVGEKQRDLEERGVAIEKVLRGESDGAQPDDAEEAQLYQSWFKLVLEKDRLGRYESELMIFAQELQLEDTQGRLQQDLRRRMAKDDTKKSESELQEEQEILAEIMRTVEKRDMLVSVLEEQRLKEKAEDRDLESLVLSKGYEFHWTPGDESWSEPEQGGVEGVTF
ncbi:protein-methionine sulfoxide oxidase mical2b isoform X3 [Thalassophryne amazonica]|uniref:protein-methionine sulfoxide oxidase mical2b isoform X3 n=1 Tax=Thalassophryne amazonica TaxID=390379 RepID=UPI001471FF4F|nr:protein-methionine sulfoxide oxidase mical2b isoform X3 [Thalassophryne amazonica]